MYINQISVFIENKPGNLAKFTNFIAENQIDMRAFEIADSSDFGIIRIIVDKPLDTLTLLKDNDWICNLTQVIGVKIPDKPGAMAKAMSILAEAGVSVEYVYTFLARGTDDALMIFRVKENDKVAAVLKKNNIKLVSQEDLLKM
ncbi:MAG: acetolactate synthase [Eubacterium sp.]|nr:acetolactate synthase [Eubacterium sp.]